MKRKDGRLIRGINPMFKLIPHIMQDRIGSQLYYTLELEEGPFNAYIKEMHSQGYYISLMGVLIACLVRLLALRPSLNRFVNKGKIYARNSIQISITIKKELSDEGDEENIKFTFTGCESVVEVQEMLEGEIRRLKKENESNDAAQLTWALDKLPA